VADEGKTFLMYDLWQAEAFVTAILANATSLKAKLTKGEKSALDGCELVV